MSSYCILTELASTLTSLDTLLDLHSKLSTVVRYYDRMLEERLSSAYSQQNLGYGGSQYYGMGAMPTQAPDIKSGAENFYYGNGADTAPPPNGAYAPQQLNSNGYEAPPAGLANPVYPAQAQRGPPTESHNNAWSHSPYPSLGSPPPTNNAMPSHAAPGPSQYYTPQAEQDPAKQQFSEPPYQPSPIMRRDSHYQPSAPPSVPEPHSPDHMQSPTYSTVPPTGPAAYQQPGGPPPQSYYYHPQQPSTVPAYPQVPTGQPGAYPEAQQQPPASHQQPARPVEESLIEL